MLKCPICNSEYKEGTVRFCGTCMYSIGTDLYLTNLLNTPSKEELLQYNHSLEEYRALWEERKAERQRIEDENRRIEEEKRQKEEEERERIASENRRIEEEKRQKEEEERERIASENRRIEEEKRQKEEEERERIASENRRIEQDNLKKIEDQQVAWGGDEKEDRTKSINLLIKLLKKVEDPDKEESIKEKVINLIDSLEIPAEEQETIKLYNDLKALKKRAADHIPSEINDAIYNKMENIVDILRSKPGNSEQVLKIEKDFKNIKMQNYLNMLLGALVLAAILYWIFG